ncbi:hypothetical protein EV421DRAFT_1989330 [Armillaria borealis]|uniref:Uncharacterized protein n=1 Tax=Armillaria borealis TaxID=47425 RepID=A0AA39J5H1_9AGAR|nr:hypothetical protein EV421DRAFT_1989330 [Armillaria borealis]
MQVLEADILIDKGLLMGAGSLGYSQLEAYGIVDLHFHLVDYVSPELEGASAADGNSLNGTAQPWLRSFDGLNTHGDAYPLSIAGVTTALVLPGSANSIDTPAVKIPGLRCKQNGHDLGIPRSAQRHFLTTCLSRLVNLLTPVSLKQG